MINTLGVFKKDGSSSNFILERPYTLFRLLNDTESEEYNYESRSADLNWTGLAIPPEIVPFTDANPPTRVFNIHVIILNEKSQNFCDSLNDFIVDRYLHTPFVGLNSGKWPRRLVLSTGNNIIKSLGTDKSGFWHQVKTYSPHSNFPNITRDDLKFGNYDKALIHTFTTIDPLGHLHASAKGIAYYPLISDVPVWVSTKRIVPIL